MSERVVSRTFFHLILLAGLVGQAALAGEPTPTAARLWNEQTLDAIRLDIPKPTVHARNLFHVSVATWDAWAAYEPDARGYFVTEKHVAADIAAARAEAISYAAYRVLKYRYRFGPGEAASQAAFDAQMAALGYDPGVTTTEGDSPAALGNRIGEAIIAHSQVDGANEGPMLDYADDSGYNPINAPLVFEFPGTNMLHPNRWQPLAFEYLVLQNGIIIGRAEQEFINPNWGQVTPFALTEDDLAFEWVYVDPGPPPQLGGVGDAEYRANAVEVITYSSQVDPADPTTIDISPGTMGNSPLGTNDGTGHDLNPYTQQPYAPNVVKRGDFGRVMAEFWADGPDSETPPGHWNALANYVSDHPLFQKRMGGTGPVLDDLEWDVKVYLALNGAVHDAAIVAWGCKGYYDYSRPISQIRYMAKRGQSSDPTGPSYHPDGIPLRPGLIEVITAETVQPGQRHEHLSEDVGEIASYSWLGTPEDTETEVGGVGWKLATQWMPYQRETFVTPAFAGYVSGHSTFSRAAAEIMTALTGSEFFPGGMGAFVAHQDEYLEFENGPSQTVELQFATYYDAADQAGISRLWGGIHPAADDLPGRIMGSTVGIGAWDRAQEYYIDRRPLVTCLSPVAVANDECVGATSCEAVASCENAQGQAVEFTCDATDSLSLGVNDVVIDCGVGSTAVQTSCEVEVVDRMAPVVSVSLTPDVLGPPVRYRRDRLRSHALVDVQALVTATDNCGTPSVVLESVVSSELDDAPGPADGSTIDDIRGTDLQTGDFDFELRAECALTGPGRVYTALYRASDSSGNESTEAGFSIMPNLTGAVVPVVEVFLTETSEGTRVEWDTAAGAVSFDVIRGLLGRLRGTEVVVDLGAVSCIEADSTDGTTAGFEDDSAPEPGEAWFYLVNRFDGLSDFYGQGSGGRLRFVSSSACE